MNKIYRHRDYSRLL